MIISATSKDLVEREISVSAKQCVAMLYLMTCITNDLPGDDLCSSSSRCHPSTTEDEEKKNYALPERIHHDVVR